MSDPNEDPRPPVWVGHVVLATPDVAEANDYWVAAGMRPITSGDGFAVLGVGEGRPFVYYMIEAPTEEFLEANDRPVSAIFRHVDAEGRSHVFQYTRGSGQGEGRLHSKRSIGVGGHISSIDAEAGRTAQPYEEGMRRELDEEVRIEPRR